MLSTSPHVRSSTSRQDGERGEHDHRLRVVLVQLPGLRPAGQPARARGTPRATALHERRRPTTRPGRRRTRASAAPSAAAGAHPAVDDPVVEPGQRRGARPYRRGDHGSRPVLPARASRRAAGCGHARRAGRTTAARRGDERQHAGHDQLPPRRLRSAGRRPDTPANAVPHSRNSHDAEQRRRPRASVRQHRVHPPVPRCRCPARRPGRRRPDEHHALGPRRRRSARPRPARPRTAASSRAAPPASTCVLGGPDGQRRDPRQHQPRRP